MSYTVNCLSVLGFGWPAATALSILTGIWAEKQLLASRTTVVLLGLHAVCHAVCSDNIGPSPGASAATRTIPASDRWSAWSPARATRRGGESRGHSKGPTSPRRLARCQTVQHHLSQHCLGSGLSCRCAARTTVSSAYAHMAKVICRYHPSNSRPRSDPSRLRLWPLQHCSQSSSGCPPSAPPLGDSIVGSIR